MRPPGRARGYVAVVVTTWAAGAVRADAIITLDSVHSRVALAVVVAISVTGAVLVNAAGSLGHGWAALRASGRALLQLLVVALVIAAVLDSRPLTLAFVALMLTVA